jgi:Mrp family chromosome partitioning ATPase
MPGEKEIGAIIAAVDIPSLGRTVGSMNLVRSLKCHNQSISVELSAPCMGGPTRNTLRARVKKELKKLAADADIRVSLIDSKPSELNSIAHIIAVMSGKGGVGKSLISALLAIGLNRRGRSVGILDADITGPSIPRMFGLRQKPVGFETGILPVLSASGVTAMSINLILDNENNPVIWRGPLIARAITQFWEDVFWGRLDYLVVDLPPGTADAPLTVMQALPIEGIIIVSTPQELASMIVNKAIRMARSTGIRILGVVENMSYLYLSDIDRRIDVFGPSHGNDLAKAAGSPLLAQLPIDTELARLSDQGRIEEYNNSLVEQITDGVEEAIDFTEEHHSER